MTRRETSSAIDRPMSNGITSRYVTLIRTKMQRAYFKATKKSRRKEEEREKKRQIIEKKG